MSVEASSPPKSSQAAESFLSPAQAGSQILRTLEFPRLEAVGYGSYAGFADGEL
jgi:hypothetical protein